jgi:predicted transposase YdaD
MQTFIDRYIEEGERRGRLEGKQEGRLEGKQEGRLEGKLEGVQLGEATILLRQIELKFGAISEQDRRRIESADAETLLKWSERVLTAESLDQLFH